MDMGIILAPLPELFSLTLIDSPNLRSLSVHASGNKDPTSEYYLHVWWALQNATEQVSFLPKNLAFYFVEFVDPTFKRTTFGE